MSEEIKGLIGEAVNRIIDNTSSPEKIEKLAKKHSSKLHFIPIQYRLFGGLVQSMNIQFGNFVEELMALLVGSESSLEVVTEYSGKKRNTFSISEANETLIDRYVADRQQAGGDPSEAFARLTKEIVANRRGDGNQISHDIDLLFRNADTGVYYYVETKYQDDHDTGKFADINRKFIKTYAYLVRELEIESNDQLVPILFYFNMAKQKENPYIPEGTHLLRGAQFFEEFLTISYDEVDSYLSEMSSDEYQIRLFENLYQSIVHEVVTLS